MNPSDLHQKITSHPAMRYQQLLFSYGHSKNILSGNSFELQLFINKLETGELEQAIGPEEFRRRFSDFDGILVRYLHNFFAAVKTLVDHTRALMDDPAINEQHRTLYQAEVQTRFKNSTIARFVQEFRNFVVHAGIPATIHITELDPETRSRVYVDVAPLLSSDRWSKSSRQYLEAHKPHLRILDVVKEYESLMIEFNTRFVRQFEEHYGPALLTLESLQLEWNRQLREGARARTMLQSQISAYAEGRFVC